MQDTKYNFGVLFSEQEMRDKRWGQFTRTELGRLFLTIPFKEIASRYPVKENHCGTKPYFSVCGGIGLMFLKSYLKLSDEKLIAQLNTSWALQLFCQMRLREGQMIKDSGIVSRWRIFLGKHLKEDEIQQVLIDEWKGDIAQPQSNVSDATCYESYIRFPA